MVIKSNVSHCTHFNKCIEISTGFDRLETAFQGKNFVKLFMEVMLPNLLNGKTMIIENVGIKVHFWVEFSHKNEN